VLMYMQVGFLNTPYDSQVELLRWLNADLSLTSKARCHAQGDRLPGRFSAPGGASGGPDPVVGRFSTGPDRGAGRGASTRISPHPQSLKPANDHLLPVRRI